MRNNTEKRFSHMNTTLNLVPTDNNNLVLQGFLTLNQVCALLTIGKSTFTGACKKVSTQSHIALLAIERLGPLMKYLK